MPRKAFKRHNEGFKCRKCGHENPPASKSERNHCAKCLYSLHVDAETPGDRSSDCHGPMPPCGFDYNGKKGFMILHRCEICKKEMWNRAAEDDELTGT